MRVVHSENPVGHVESEADQLGDGHATRNLASPVATHAVGHDHHVVDFLIALRHVSCWKTRADRLERTSEPDDEVMVFVVGPSMSGMRERADVDPD